MNDKKKKSALYDVLDRIFRLPPKTERRDLEGTFWHKYLLWRKIPVNREDSYILYQAQKCGYIYCGVVIALLTKVFFTKENIDLGYVVLRGDVAFSDFSMQVTSLAAPVTAFVMLPFFLIKLHWNFDATKRDVLKLWKPHEKKHGRILVSFSLLLCVGLLIFHACYVLTPRNFLNSFKLEWLYAENYYYFLLFAIFVSAVLVSLAQVVLFSSVVLRRYFFLYRKEVSKLTKK